MEKIPIYCNKQNTRVFVDGRDHGKTPSKGELIIDILIEGYHELTISKEGYQTWKQTIKVYGGETLSVDVYLSKLGSKCQIKNRGLANYRTALSEVFYFKQNFIKIY